jgi:hypothetical protein
MAEKLSRTSVLISLVWVLVLLQSNCGGGASKSPPPPHAASLVHVLYGANPLDVLSAANQIF